MNEVTYMGEGAGHPLPSRVANVPRRQIACASVATTDRHDHRQDSEGGAYRGGGLRTRVLIGPAFGPRRTGSACGGVRNTQRLACGAHGNGCWIRAHGHRPKLMKVLADPSIAIVAVEHRDRLLRFGAE